MTPPPSRRAESAPVATNVSLDWPLMRNNITRRDLDEVIRFLERDNPNLTQSEQVCAFEHEWSEWLGVRYSLLVNSGSSANLITLAALRERDGTGEVIVPALTWISDISSVLHCGFTPVFVDIDPRTLGMDTEQVLDRITRHTRAVFLTHILGYNALTRRLLDELAALRIPLLEDVCESHGATFEGRKLGTFGLMSNFSFYYAHHMTTIEGGVVSTDDDYLYQLLRMFRSHGLVRESTSESLKAAFTTAHPDLNPEFIFAFPAYNVRSTEINAVLGRTQIRRLDGANALRRRNLDVFLANLDPGKYRTDFNTDGSCNYALTLVLRRADEGMCARVIATLRAHRVEFRRGTSGGGNQLRQPYLQSAVKPGDLSRFPEVEHIHFHGFYIGNYPELEPDKILALCTLLNAIPASE